MGYDIPTKKIFKYSKILDEKNKNRILMNDTTSLKALNSEKVKILFR